MAILVDKLRMFTDISQPIALLCPNPLQMSSTSLDRSQKQNDENGREMWIDPTTAYRCQCQYLRLDKKKLDCSHVNHANDGIQQIQADLPFEAIVRRSCLFL